MQALLRHLFIWLLLASGVGAGATQRALLVGVSELANQPQSLWLQAPRNDVILMRQALAKQGFASGDITVLADGVGAAGLPDAQQIRDSLARLLDQSRSGDFVVLYFSGHGTRLRDNAKRYQEPDGLAENFLARDARMGAAAGQALSGGMRDVDFDGWIQAFLARDVFVWALFDTCSAASMTRGVPGRMQADPGPADDEVRFRGVKVDELARSSIGAAPAPVEMAAPPVAPVPRARYVAFFASESHQVTPELRLPRNDRTARPQGLLTWAVTESLSRRPATFRDLYNDVVSLYPPVIAELEARFPQRELPSPVAEGNLDAPLFANAPAPLSTRPAWPARRTGASLALTVGQLDGLEPQQDVRVSATLADGNVRSGNARLDAVDLASARVQVPAALADLADATVWAVSPLSDPPSVVLRVQTDRNLPRGLSLAYPAAIRAVRAGSDADVRWTAQGIEVLSPTLAALLGDASKTPLMTTDAAELRRQLVSLAELKWLARLNTLAQDGRLDGFEATIEVWNGDKLVRSMPALQAAAAPQPPMNDGERAMLMVRNTSGQSLDLVIVGVDATGVIRQVFPQAISETNRFERGTRDAPSAKRFELPWLGASRGGRVLVVATPASPFSAPRLFGANAPDTMPDLRVRGQLQPDRQRQVYSALVGWTSDR
ncbi:caspase family protein [Variovorax sp. J22R133]|uniref:caspase family protein n=1 Tax=Variovorax brevis TaxID=3053503 RepID=UPI002575F4B1|nr:caspase family protein [Variovorax sp. J22R133]MDM0117242.1 caspase family protein [Variovorax sp. J22R133]